MGLLDFLFGKKEEPVNIAPGAETKRPVESGFKSADWVVREAFEKVMASVECPQETKKALLKSFTAAHKSGDPRAEENVVISHLAGSGWIWREFDRWAEEFKRRGKWPPMWQNFPCLYESAAPVPQSSELAVTFFAVAELREWLKQHAISVKPAPRSRNDFAKVFKERVGWKDFEQTAARKHQEYLGKYKRSQEEAKCKLLAHTLAMTTYTLIHYHKGKETLGDTVVVWKWEVSVPGADPIEAEFARQFDPNAMKNLPPYFPGDRNGLHLNYVRVKS